MSINRVYLLPVSIFVLMPSTFLITYIIAVSLGHVSAGFPYISDTGTYSPESCIFSQLLNIIGLLIWLFGWVRYAQVNQLCGTELGFGSVLTLNRIAFWLITAASIGTSIVANFQETNLLVIHVLGALMLFLPGLAYTWFHAIISFRTVGTIGTRRTSVMRLAFAILGSIVFLIMNVVTPLAFILFHGHDYRKWGPDDGGFVFHVVSTVSEWILCIGFALFLLTFTAEFRGLHIEPAEIRKRILTNEEQLQNDVDERNEEPNREIGEGVATPVEEQLYRPIVVRTEPYRELYA